jgi:uncharacterized protein (DUF924 family)
VARRAPARAPHHAQAGRSGRLLRDHHGVERRIVEIIRHRDLDLVEIVTTVDSHGAEAGSLAALHRDLAERFGGSQVRNAMAGREDDRDARMYVRRPTR